MGKILTSESFSMNIPGRYWILLACSTFTVNLMFLWNLTEDNTPIRKLAIEDSRTVVNFREFEYLIPKPKCEFRYNDARNVILPYYIVFVHSAPTNFERRSVIRDTWAHYDTRSKTYFLLGAVNSSRLQEQIIKEDNEFGDIIQGNFLDSHRNLTYKHVMGLKWFSYNCANAKYMVKMDDHVFINTPNVFKYLVNNNETTDFMMGKYIGPYPPFRTGEYAVTEEEYAPYFYPSFADRFAIIYSNDVVIRLYKKAQRMKFFWVDDVFVTGLLRLQLNVAITDIRPYTLNRTNIDTLKMSSTTLPDEKFMFSVDQISADDQRLIWEKTEWSRLNLNLEFE